MDFLPLELHFPLKVHLHFTQSLIQRVLVPVLVPVPAPAREAAVKLHCVALPHGYLAHGCLPHPLDPGPLSEMPANVG